MIARATRAWRSAPIGRFIAAGGFVMVVYVGLTSTLFALGLPTQAALAIGYFTSVSLHFVIYRELVFKSSEGYALAASSQLRRFVVTVALQYTVTALSVGLLPQALGLPRMVVYLATAGTVAVVTFTVLRLFLFHSPTTGGTAR